MNSKKKATAIEASVLVASGILAAGISAQLAAHDVSVPMTVSVVLFVLVTGQYFANSLTQGLRTTYYACPIKGCTASIRATGTGKAELAALRTLATDHSKHGAAR